MRREVASKYQSLFVDASQPDSLLSYRTSAIVESSRRERDPHQLIHLHFVPNWVNPPDKTIALVVPSPLARQAKLNVDQQSKFIRQFRGRTSNTAPMGILRGAQPGLREPPLTPSGASSARDYSLIVWYEGQIVPPN